MSRWLVGGCGRGVCIVDLSGSGSIPPISALFCMNPRLVMSVGRQILIVGCGRYDTLVRSGETSSHDRISEQQQCAASLSFYFYFYILFRCSH